MCSQPSVISFYKRTYVRVLKKPPPGPFGSDDVSPNSDFDIETFVDPSLFSSEPPLPASTRVQISYNKYLPFYKAPGGHIRELADERERQRRERSLRLLRTEPPTISPHLLNRGFDFESKVKSPTDDLGRSATDGGIDSSLGSADTTTTPSEVAVKSVRLKLAFKGGRYARHGPPFKMKLASDELVDIITRIRDQGWDTQDRTCPLCHKGYRVLGFLRAHLRKHAWVALAEDKANGEGQFMYDLLVFTYLVLRMCVYMCQLVWLDMPGSAT
ncbi:hypothetical protein FA13DRAFT_1802507 [Coprinellus micaceus]|uniref:C2H2-type domain-containing protein n=1 Tax=Coprinellus micaceus TaxID=71717 RepID=A0A4Y7SC40_COPMI|nr:hypothetical protein FA13DRAFT_1802507 [Coprinellus micaceus]